MSRAVEILLVEDNPGDVDLARVALQDSEVDNHVHVARDGVEALSYLAGEYPPECGLPDLILLDLNLPKMDGREVLAEIKADEKLQQIPVIVMTSSDSEQDVARSYELKANCYVTKPVELDAYRRMIQSIEELWLKRVRLPSGAR